MISQIEQAKARKAVVIAIATEGDRFITSKQIRCCTSPPRRRC